jgi:hypothetical protein
MPCSAPKYFWEAFLIATRSPRLDRCTVLLVRIVAFLAFSPPLFAAPTVVISPSAIDFGVVHGSLFGNQELTGELISGVLFDNRGTGDGIDVEVRNSGPGPLTIRDVQVDGALLYSRCPDTYGGSGVIVCRVVIQSHPCGDTGYTDGQLALVLPIVLQEGSSCHFTVYYVQEGLGDLHGTFTVLSDASTSPDVAPITAVRNTYVFYGLTVPSHQRAVVTFSDFIECGLTEATFLPEPGQPDSAPSEGVPAGLHFPYGLFSFVARPCQPGTTKTVSLQFPNPLPPETAYWKYGPTPSNHSPHWYKLPATVQGNSIEFNITDGGLGDDDLTPNGIIVDQGGPAVLSDIAVVPALSRPAFAALLIFLLGLGMAVAMRRHH